MTAEQNIAGQPADDTTLPSDSELFKNAMAPELPERPEQPPPEAPPQEPGERPRDEQGRFKRADDEQAPEAPAAATQQPPAPSPQPGQQPDENIPSWRAREIREQRDQLEQRSRQLEQIVLEQQRQFQLLQSQYQQQQPREPEKPPDMIANPEAYHAYMQNQFAEQMRRQEANFSFRMARAAHGGLFDEAFATMLELSRQGDPSVAQSVMRSPDPGEAVCVWYSKERANQITGGDPLKWHRSYLEEQVAKDAKYRGELLELVHKHTQQTQAAQAANGQPSPVQLPPSLNRMAAAAPVDTGGDMSNDSLFDYAFRQGRGRR